MTCFGSKVTMWVVLMMCVAVVATPATQNPTKSPTNSPTKGPTKSPSFVPTAVPTQTKDLSMINFESGALGYNIIGGAAGDAVGGLASGDFNVDGIHDVVISASTADPPSRSGAGIVYVIFGKSGVDADYNLANFVTSASTGFQIFGPAAGANLGAVATGDINGDGYDDLYLGAYSYNSNQGRVYVLYGHNSSVAAYADVDLATFVTGAKGFKITSSTGNTFLGGTVSSIGDVNHDGIDDLGIGSSGRSPFSRSNAGIVYIVFGRRGAAPFTDLSADSFAVGAAYGAKYCGPEAGDKLSVVAGAGDVNDDGIDDIVMGAQMADFGRTDAGVAYIIFGHASNYAWTTVDLAASLTGIGIAIYGGAAGDRCGIAVGGIGDINGDGIGDVAVGCFLASPLARSLAGSVLVLFGNASIGSTDVDLLTFASGRKGFEVLGRNTQYQMGRTIGSADLNGDGYSDLIVGSPQATITSGLYYYGIVTVIYGHSAALPFPDIDARIVSSYGNAYNIFGAYPRTFFGLNVMGTRDINGDGTDDLMVSSYLSETTGVTGSGAAWVIYGKGPPTASPTALPTMLPSQVPSAVPSVIPSAVPSAVPTVTPTAPTCSPTCIPTALPSTARPSAKPTAAPSTFGDTDLLFFAAGEVGYSATGVAAGDRVGSAVSGAGDFNGDGIDDILIGAPYAEALGRTDAGIAYLIFGQPGHSTLDFDLATFVSGSRGVRVWGPAAGGLNGAAVSGVGDVNSDGFADIVIGAPLVSTGRAFVLFGHNGTQFPFTDIDLSAFSSGSRGFTVQGVSSNDQLGWAVSGAGDVNGDGIDDLVVGVPYHDSLSRSDAGAVIVIFGHSADYSFVTISFDTFSAGFTTGFRVYGAAAGDLLGHAVDSAGDVNGDGIDDIVLSAVGADPHGLTAAGIVYVLFGKVSTYSWADQDLSSFAASLSVGFSIAGPAASAQAGYAVSGVGDLDGDGTDEILIGAPGVTVSGKAGAGVALVLFGNSTIGLSDVEMATFTSGWQGFQIFASGAGDALGKHACSAGDVNGDGHVDIVVSAVTADPLSRSDAGVTYVIFGHSGDLPFIDIDLSSVAWGNAGFKVLGAVALDQSGVFAGLGDVNGDGTDDFLTAAPRSTVGAVTEAGTVYVFYGQGPPSAAPTALPTRSPSTAPTFSPSCEPTMSPTCSPTTDPTALPTGPSWAPTLAPSALPTASPTAHSSAAPTVVPTAEPTTHPSVSPSAQPSISSAAYAQLTSSPTYTVRNGFAFAALADNGMVHTWGEAAHGGDSSVVQASLQSGVRQVRATRFAFAALKDDGQLVAWGAAPAIRGATTVNAAVRDLVANEAAFAGLDESTGRVVSFGSAHDGGAVHTSACYQQLAYDVLRITASAGAFTALKYDGTVYTWGNPHTGAGVSTDTLPALMGVNLVVATREAFAALLSTGRVISWGGALCGGDSSAVSDRLQSGVIHVVASSTVFVAVKHDLSAVTWGYGPWGGDSSAVASQLTSGVASVAHTLTAVAVLKTDGSVVTWGDSSGGGDSSAVQAQLVNIVYIYGGSKAFAAVNSTSGVVAWGKAAYGGQIPSNKVSALSSGVVSIYKTDRAFAALKDDGSVVVWGQAGHGGSPGAAVEAYLVSGVHTICANDAAFSVIKTDGSVVGWGHPVSIPTAGVLFNSSSLLLPAIC